MFMTMLTNATLTVNNISDSLKEMIVFYETTQLL